MTSPKPPGELDDEPPPSTDPAPVYICPRCGGHAVPRRQPRRSNPFLYYPITKSQLTCVDCGLDFETEVAGNPWVKRR